MPLLKNAAGDALTTQDRLDIQAALPNTSPIVTIDGNSIPTLVAGAASQFLAPSRTLAQILALTPATYAGMVVRCTNVGRGGSHWYSDGTRWRAVGGVIDLVTTSLTSAGGASNFVLGEAAIPAGLWQAGDEIEMLPVAIKSGTSETATVATFTGTVSGTPGVNLNLGTAAMAAANNQLAPRYGWVRLSATSVGAATISGSIGVGASPAPASSTVSNLDSVAQFVQFVLSGMSSTVETVSMRSFRVRLHTCGA